MHLSRQTGLSLIEVLVTVLILGLGLLGVAALQITSLESSQNGYSRTTATEIAESLAANTRLAKNAIYDGSTRLGDVLTMIDRGITPIDCAASITTCGSGTSCNLTELIRYNQHQACVQANTFLPSGEVYQRIINNVRMQIAVAWEVTAREDTGQKIVTNARCVQFALPANKDCIILDVIP